MQMKLNFLLLVPFLLLTTVSCNNHQSISTEGNDDGSQSDNKEFDFGYYPPDKVEEFDLSKTYIGYSISDFIEMASGYNFCTDLEALQTDEHKSYFTSSSSIHGFSFEDYDVFAIHEKKSITNIIVKEKKFLTFSEVSNLGFFGQKETIHTEIRFRNDVLCQSTETYYISNFKTTFSFENFLDFGMWDSLMVFLDRGPIGGYFFNGINATLWPAFTIYSDDLSEILGVSIPMSSGYFWTFTKDDGYDQKITPEIYVDSIKKAQETNDYFGRAAFYFKPCEFDTYGTLAYFKLIGGEIDL